MPVVVPDRCTICGSLSAYTDYEYPGEFTGYLCDQCLKAFFFQKQKQLNLDSENEMLLLLLTRLAKKLEKVELLKKYGAKALHIKPNLILNRDTWWDLDKESYQQVYKRLPMGSKASIRACMNLGYVCSKSDLFEDAIYWWEKALLEGDKKKIRNSEILDVCEDLMDLYIKCQRYQNGISLFEKYRIKLDAQGMVVLKGKILVFLATLYECTSQYDRATYCLETAIKELKETTFYDDNLDEVKKLLKRIDSRVLSKVRKKQDSVKLYECPSGIPFESMEKKNSLLKRFKQSVFRLIAGKRKEQELAPPSTQETIGKKPSAPISSSSEGKALSEQDIKYLTETAESCIDSNDLQQGLKYYNQLIESTVPHPHYYKRRALILRIMGDIDDAINDMNKAIDLDADDGDSYWKRGACYAHKLSLEKNIEKNKKIEMLGKILKDYKDSVKRNPTSSEAWLAILETDMLLHNWDDAISNYGSCKQYINTNEYQLVRSWLGCLALIFSDEPIEDEDMKYLKDTTIRLKRTNWCVSEIDSLFVELENERFSKVKLKMAEEIHKTFLDHFDEPPMRF